jgi:hypothetical protein
VCLIRRGDVLVCSINFFSFLLSYILTWRTEKQIDGVLNKFGGREEAPRKTDLIQCMRSDLSSRRV